MKPNFKVLSLSFMVILTIASHHAIYGMEDYPKPDEQDVKRSYDLRVSCGPNMIEESQQKKKSGEEVRENPFEWCPKEITAMILHRASIDECLNNSSPVNILLVCREWRNLIEEITIAGKTVKKLCQEAWYGVPGHEEIYERFLKGVLIYKPKEKSEEGMITMRISDLVNPVEGTFDLSQCGEVGKYLSISTGYRKRNKAENANKVEIWLAPRFLIEKKLTTTASHFQDIYGKWNDNAPVGIFLTWGKWDNLTDYDYLVTENFDQLSKNSLYEKSRKMNNEELWSWIGASMDYIYVHFRTK